MFCLWPHTEGDKYWHFPPEAKIFENCFRGEGPFGTLQGGAAPPPGPPLCPRMSYITVNRPFNPFGWHRIGPWKRQLSEWRNQEPQTLWSFQLTSIPWQWNWGPSGPETVPAFRNLFHFCVHSNFLYGHCCREHPLHWQRPFWSLYHGCSHS